jgi:hypothetical protein
LHTNSLHLEIDFQKSSLTRKRLVLPNESFSRFQLLKFNEQKRLVRSFSSLVILKSRQDSTPNIGSDELFDFLRAYMSIEPTYINYIIVTFID